MKHYFRAAVLFGLLVFAWIAPSHAQSNAPVYLPSGCGTGNISGNGDAYTTVNGVGQTCVTASVSVSGFTPGMTFATLTATGSSASVALPAGAVVAVQNTGTTTVSCTLGIGSATALASEIQVPASSTVFVTVGTNTWGACIDQSGSTSNLVVLAGGSGLGTGFGGGGGGSGGSTNITQTAGTNINAAIAATGALPVDVLTTGNLYAAATAPVPCKAAATWNASTGLTGTQPAGCDGSAAPWGDIGAWGGAAVGGQANFGTSPGAVSAIGVNASLFYGTSAAVGDPCQTGTKSSTAISQTTNTKLFSAVSSKINYVCSFFIMGADAENLSLVEGTGTVCATNTAPIIGGTTAANGANFAANNGVAHGNGAAYVAAGANANFDVCLFQSGSGRVAGTMTVAR